MADLNAQAMASPTTSVHTQVHPQLQSPLFNTIPGELRNEIFRLALAEYTDPNALYPRDSYYTRPGNLGEKRIATELLRTCKRIYQETKLLPMQSLLNTEITFYGCWESRAPPEYRYVPGFDQETYIPPRATRFSASQWAQIRTIRLVPQLYALDGLCGNISRTCDNGTLAAPKTIKILIRYTDWWEWETSNALDLRGFDPRDFMVPDSVDKIEMEFETRSGKEKELEVVLAQIRGYKRRWTFPRKDGQKLVPQNEMKGWTWVGPTSFEQGDSYAHHPRGNDMVYVVKVMTWLLE